MVQVLDKDCSGRHSCKVNTRDLIVAGMKPCPKDLRNYLEARYKCVPGMKIINRYFDLNATKSEVKIPCLEYKIEVVENGQLNHTYQYNFNMIDR